SRLRTQPLVRLKTWISSRSLQYALGYAIAVYCVSFVLLWLLAFDMSDQPTWAQDFQTDLPDGLVWYPFDERFFYANAAAIVLSSVATPLIYFIRRYSLRWRIASNSACLRTLPILDRLNRYMRLMQRQPIISFRHPTISRTATTGFVFSAFPR